MAAAMPYVMLASAAVGAVSRMQSASAHADLADEARRNSEVTAAYIEMQGREEERRFRYQAEKEKGLARARAAASGVTMEGTPGLYLEEMSRLADEEIDWLRMSTRFRADQTRRSGRYAQQQGYLEAGAQRRSAWSSLISAGGEFGASQGWWQS